MIAGRRAENRGALQVAPSLSDLTAFGRTYDQQQWQHAYGMSPLWVFAEDAAQSSGWRTLDHVEPGIESYLRRGAEDGSFIGLVNYAHYFATPALSYSVWNSLTVALITTAITVPLAFVFAYLLLTQPLANAASRRYEAEADWLALEATRDPEETTRDPEDP